MKLEDRIYYIQTSEFCEEIAQSDGCEGDCICCRAHYTVKAINVQLRVLKKLAVSCDNNIRVKFPTPMFNELMDNCLSTEVDA